MTSEQDGEPSTVQYKYRESFADILQYVVQSNLEVNEKFRQSIRNVETLKEGGLI